MLSPRTLALRRKNRDLLEALDLKLCDKIKNYNVGPELERNTAHRTDIHDSSLQQCSDTSRHIVLGDQSVLQQLTQTYSHDNFSGIQSTLSSGDPTHTKVYDVISGTQNSYLKRNSQNNMKKNVSDSRTSERLKSISLQQQRAAEVQMHAPTHSHAISKCYCTQENNIQAKADSKYVVQLYSQKQRIPTRVKQQRYRAASVPRNLRAVRWADTCDQFDRKWSKIDDLATLPSGNSSEVSVNYAHATIPEICPSRQYENEPEINLLDKVKHFRESHWSDCHATTCEGTSPADHECVKHYVLNERLFLEPLHKDEGGYGTCPVCPSSSNNSCRTQCLKESLYSPLKSTSQNQSNHIIVTLPKVIQEPDNLSRGVSLSSQNNSTGDSKKACYSVSHHIGSAKKSTFVCPSDTLALRYQKRDI